MRKFINEHLSISSNREELNTDEGLKVKSGCLWEIEEGVKGKITYYAMSLLYFIKEFVDAILLL